MIRGIDRWRCALVAPSCQTLGDPRDRRARLLCPWDSSGKDTGVGSHFLFQGIFPTQGLNPGLLHCRRMLYHLSYSEKNPPARCGLDPLVGKVPWKKWHPLQYSCLENSIGRGDWWAAVHGDAKSQTRLSR